MKNKKSLYILIPLVLVVWGMIGHKIFLHIRSDNNELDIPSSNIQATLVLESEPDSFNITNNYVDPFLKNTSTVSPKPKQNKQTNDRKPSQTKNRIAQRKQHEIQRIQWPDVVYNGVVTNKKDQTKTILLSINGKQKLMKPLEVYDGVKLLKIYNDSIRVGYKEHEKNILKNVLKQI